MTERGKVCEWVSQYEDVLRAECLVSIVCKVILHQFIDIKY